MAKMGLFIDYEFCTGCHTCEVSCKMEHDLPEGEWGIKLAQVGPWQVGKSDKWQYDYIPIPTIQCSLCAERTTKDKLPICVHNCQSACMKYGPVEDLAKIMANKEKTVIFAPL
jgi:anaerobic dimethyl sulfoxide reductase subunit B (iron-sulfur subunit)